MKLIQYISTSYVREELYNPDNCDLINPKSPPEFISSGGPFCHKVELEGFEPSYRDEPINAFRVRRVTAASLRLLKIANYRIIH